MESPSEGRFVAKAARSLVILVTHPRRAFARVREPVDHGAVVGLLVLVRLPPWLVLVSILGVNFARDPGRPELGNFALSPVMSAASAAALSTWLLLLVPLGIPLMYFLGGVLSHAGLAMTGGVRRSVGASMRAFGLAAAPSLLLLSLAEIPLHLGLLPVDAWGYLLALAFLLNAVLLIIALTRTHEIWLVRTVLVAPVPVYLLYAVITFRAALVAPSFPFQPPPPPPSPYLPIEI